MVRNEVKRLRSQVPALTARPQHFLNLCNLVRRQFHLSPAFKNPATLESDQRLASVVAKNVNDITRGRYAASRMTSHAFLAPCA